MVTVDGDCRVNKSEESKWLDWRGKARGEGGDGELRRTSGGIKLEENGLAWGQTQQRLERRGGLKHVSLLLI